MKIIARERKRKKEVREMKEKKRKEGKKEGRKEGKGIKGERAYSISKFFLGFVQNRILEFDVFPHLCEVKCLKLELER